MGVRMLLINPLGTDMFDGITVDLVQPHLAADTEVVCRSLAGGVPRTPFLAPPASYHDPLVGAVAAAADEGFDVVGISCCGDPALADCRAASRIPVTAPMEATAAASTALGPVCIVQRKLPAVYAERMPTQRDNTWMRDMMRRYGMPDERVDFRQTACQLPEAAHGVVEHLDLVVRKHLKAIEFTNCILVVVEYGNFHRASLVLQRTMNAIDAVISFPVPPIEKKELA